MERIRWHLLKFKAPFNPEVFAQTEARQSRNQVARLQHADALGFILVPAR